MHLIFVRFGSVNIWLSSLKCIAANVHAYVLHAASAYVETMQTSINMSQKSATAFRLNKRSTRSKEHQPFLPVVGVPPPPIPLLANIGKKKVGR
jgi:hypothetical protein